MMAQLEVRMPSETSSHRTPIYLGSVVTVSGALAAGLVFALLSARNQALHPIAYGAASASGVGLVAGFVSRLSLLHRSRAIRSLVALVGVCIGLIFLGWLSRGAYGVHLLRLHPEIPDWRGLLQLFTASASALLAVCAWDRRLTIGQRLVGQVRVGRAHIMGAVQTRVNTLRNLRGPAVSVSPTPRQQERHRPAAQLTVRQTPSRTRSQGSQLVRQKPVRRVRRRPKVAIRLSAAQEHRCPYCLELVDPDDPRGVEICPICHTLHHADCWAVTGTCQVPHHHK
jgi:hypothetical protein